VQTWSRFGVPFTTARTRCTLGSQRRFVRRCDLETRLPKNGFFPQMSQTAAMTRASVTEGLGQPGAPEFPVGRIFWIPALSVCSSSGPGTFCTTLPLAS